MIVGYPEVSLSIVLSQKEATQHGCIEYLLNLSPSSDFFFENKTVVKSLQVNGEVLAPTQQEHKLIIPKASLKDGANSIRIEFETDQETLK